MSTRKERIEFLTSCGIELLLAEEHVPKVYEEIPDFIWLDVIKNVIKPLYQEEDYLREYHFEEFNISGHTEGVHYRPWQMVGCNRIGY